MSTIDKQTIAKRFRFLCEAAAWRYRAQGIFVHRQVREQLERDPFYRDLLASNRLPLEGNIVALGCGRGILLALLASALGLGMVEGAKRGRKPRLVGMESRPDMAESARLALADEAEITACDLSSATLPSCRAVILQDVLLYLQPDGQDRLLESAALALEAEGLIVVRETVMDSLGCRLLVWIADRFLGLLPGASEKKRYRRNASEWKMRLESLGFNVEIVSTTGLPGLCKMLLMARKSV